MARSDGKPAKHRIVTVRMMVVSLVIGVVLAVGSVPVAAWCAKTPWPFTGTPPNHTKSWSALDKGLIHVTRRYDHWGGTRWWSFHWDTMEAQWHTHTGEAVLFASDPRPVLARPLYSLDWVDYSRRGWPVAAAEGRRLKPHSNPGQPECMRLVVFRGEAIQVPLRPIWTGLLANTAFYTAIAFVPLAGLRLVRTRRRRARGRCVACNYQLGAGIIVCPECGLAKEEGNGHSAMGNGSR